MLTTAEGSAEPAPGNAVLMTDIEGSVALWDLDPVAMSLAVVAHEALIEQVVTERGGHLVRSRGEGDSTFSVFSAATAAVGAAAAIHERLLAMSWPTRQRARVRIAISTRAPDDPDGDLVGAVPNRGARLRALVAGDQIVLSAATAQAVVGCVPHGWDVAPIGAKVLRGFRRPEPAFVLRPTRSTDKIETSSIPSDLSWVGSATTPFVGRGEQLVTTSAAIGHATANGRGPRRARLRRTRHRQIELAR